MITNFLNKINMIYNKQKNHLDNLKIKLRTLEIRLFNYYRIMRIKIILKFHNLFQTSKH